MIESRVRPRPVSPCPRSRRLWPVVAPSEVTAAPVMCLCPSHPSPQVRLFHFSLQASPSNASLFIVPGVFMARQRLSIRDCTGH